MRLFLESAAAAISSRLALFVSRIGYCASTNGYMWMFTRHQSRFHVSLMEHGSGVRLRLLKQPFHPAECSVVLRQQAIGPLPASLYSDPNAYSVAEIRYATAQYWQSSPLTSVTQTILTLDVMLDVAGVGPAPVERISGAC